VAVMESTYGSRTHERRDEVEELAKVVEKAEKTTGVVLIPSFSLQRSQEILYIFDQLKKKGKMKEGTMVFLDSPMAIRATEIFKKFPGLLNKGLREQMRKDDPFDFPGLTLSDKAEISRQIKKVPAPKVIVAGSGMMTGGRILHHVMEYISSPTTQIVFVGYQAEGTLGRQIIDGAKTVNIWGNERRVGAEIINIESMSAHADQGQLLNWVKKIWGVRKVVLVHGEEIPRLTLKEKIKQEMDGVKVELPIFNQTIEL